MAQANRNPRKKPSSGLRDPYPWVRVEWLDSCEIKDNSDLELSQLPEPQQLIQCGFLVKDEKEYVLISGAIKSQTDGTYLFDYTIAIPKVVISKITKLVCP